MPHNISLSQGYGVASLGCWEAAQLLSGVAMMDYVAGTRVWEQGLTTVLQGVALGLGHGNMCVLFVLEHYRAIMRAI
jgi:hypothetical protein